jgi:DNA repair protein RadC
MLNQPSIIAEISVSYYPKLANSPRIIRSEEAYPIFMRFFPNETIHLQERFMVMYLNCANRVIGIYPISTGGITGTVADTRLILGVALKVAATSLMLAHNHPSGNLNPSQNDLQLTSKIKEAAKFMDIRVIDHFILSPEEGKYLSFADEGLM